VGRLTLEWVEILQTWWRRCFSTDGHNTTTESVYLHSHNEDPVKWLLKIACLWAGEAQNKRNQRDHAKSVWSDRTNNESGLGRCWCCFAFFAPACTFLQLILSAALFWLNGVSSKLKHAQKADSTLCISNGRGKMSTTIDLLQTKTFCSMKGLMQTDRSKRQCSNFTHLPVPCTMDDRLNCVEKPLTCPTFVKFLANKMFPCSFVSATPFNMNRRWPSPWPFGWGSLNLQSKATVLYDRK